jgi:hypothetical protein
MPSWRRKGKRYLFYFTSMYSIVGLFPGVKRPEHVVNALTPELNPSTQRCLTKFLLGILLLEPCISLIYPLKNQQMQQLFIQFINHVS